MTFAFHHPSYYKKLKQNSGRSLSSPSKDNVSEKLSPPTMGTKIERVSVSVSPGVIIAPSFRDSTHANHKENK